jgi:hypothetical protein
LSPPGQGQMEQMGHYKKSWPNVLFTINGFL